MVPSEEEGKPHQPGEPELPPEQIQAKIEKDRALWYKHADGLKAAALEAVQVAKARDLDGLFKVGDKVDKACEACHLEYWYPGRPRSGAQGSEQQSHLRPAQEEVAGTFQELPERATRPRRSRPPSSAFGRAYIAHSTATDPSFTVRVQLPASRPSITMWCTNGSLMRVTPSPEPGLIDQVSILVGDQILVVVGQQMRCG